MVTITSFRDGSVEARGLRFHYLEWGKAASPAMVLLHGLSSHAHSWDHFAAALQDRYHVFALDQRGHGDSDWAERAAAAEGAPASGGYATEDYVADLEAVVDSWRLERFVLGGLSMGGHSAMAFAAQNPGRVERLVVIDIAPSFNRELSPNWREWERLAHEGHPRFDDPEFAFEQARLNNSVASDEMLRHRARYAVRQLPDGKYTFKYDSKAPYLWRPADLWSTLPEIRVPTLIVRGELSEVVSDEVARRMVAALADARLVTVEGSGHQVPADRPAEFEKVVRDFLES